jgi:hypothetical protein
MFFSPSMGEVGYFQLAACLPYMFGLLFLDEDLVRGDEGLDATIFSGPCLIFLPFGISCIGLSLLYGVCASRVFSISFFFNSLFSW